MGIKAALFSILLYTASLSLQADSKADADAALSQTLTLSYVSHPVTENVLVPLIRESYQSLGLNINFMAVEAERGLRLLQEGMVDGDVARTDLVLATLDNVVTVAKLDELKLELHCRPGLQCKLDDLTNPGVLLFFPESARSVRELDLKITAQKYHVRDWSQLVLLYNADKVDRFLWVSSTLTCVNPVANTSAVVIPAAPIEIYHVIHKSKSDLLKPLQIAIEKELTAFKTANCR